MTKPRAFLSHSSADKGALGDRLAADLTASGIDVRYDDWAIQPGDSLRRKIDAGIEGATHFLALITPNSLKSEWVQVELDAAMVKKIQGTCRLVPVLANVQLAELPPTLQAIKVVRIEDYDKGLRELISVCHNVTLKPALGAAPSWAIERPLGETRFSVQAQRLATPDRRRAGVALTYRVRVRLVR